MLIMFSFGYFQCLNRIKAFQNAANGTVLNKKQPTKKKEKT